MSKNDGGPAFPRTAGPKDGYGNPTNPSQSGMSLRDWFAGQALMGQNASPELMVVVTAGDIKDGSAFQRQAKAAYAQADAMIAERNK